MAAQAKRQESESPTASRLLPELLSDERLGAVHVPRILDFGRASADMLALLSEHRCHLRVLDAADELLGLSARTAEADDPNVCAEPADFTELFPELKEQRFDTVLLWDSLNLLHQRDLPAFFSFLSSHLYEGYHGHGFMLQKQGLEPRLRYYGLSGGGQLRLVDEKAAKLHVHSRKIVSQAMAPSGIERAVLRSDGRQEFLFL